MKKVKQKRVKKQKKKIVIVAPFHPSRLKKIKKYRTMAIREANKRLLDQLTKDK